MVDFDRIRAAKNGAEARLRSIPGVHAVGVGPKITGGKHTGQPSIIVFVDKKKPLAELSPEEVIPAEIDGIKTDVHEAGRPRLVSEDTSNYRPLRGGIQIQPGGGLGGLGTLGCIARNDELEAVFALTCEHVVGMAAPAPTDLSATIAPGSLAITFSGANTIGAIVVVDLSVTPTVGQPVLFDIIQRADPGMTPAAVAQGVSDKVKALMTPGFSASVTGAQVTFAAVPPNTLSLLSCNVDGLHYLQDSGVRVKIVDNVITLSGESNSNGAAYVAINLGGSQPSYGVYVLISKGDSSSEIADAIAEAITHRKLAGVLATSGNSAVTVVGAEELECDISTDRRVGQSTNCFCSKCCCCNDRIGTVYDARLDLDLALVKLDPGLKYRAEIYVDGTNDWLVKGKHALTDAEVIKGPYNVKKRGRTTQVTRGIITATAVNGVALNIHYSNDTGGGKVATVFHRHYIDAMLITPNSGDFAQGGDSGSALLNDNNEVLGIVFAGGKGVGIGVASPIQPMLDAFTLIVQTADKLGQDQTVPGEETQFLVGHADSPAVSAKEIAPPFADAIMRHLKVVESEITATPAGREYLNVALQHVDEAQRMVNMNRRVAAVWKRNLGPQIAQAALSVTSSRDRRFPSEIQGKPLAECLHRIYEVFLRYGSPELAADLRALGPRLFDLCSVTYGQALAMLGEWEPKRVTETYDGR